MANDDGTERIPYVPDEGDLCIDKNGRVAKGLTYEGELNKVRRQSGLAGVVVCTGWNWPYRS